MRLTITGFVLLTGCDHEERISKLEKQSQELVKQNQELQAEVKKDRAAAEYDMQAKCAKDSRLWFNENYRFDKTTILLNYTDHYNKSLNKCFIEVEYHYKLADPSWTNDLSLWDIYENEEYGSVNVNHFVSFKPEYHDSETVGSCKVYGKECKTIDEFNNLASPFMNN